jgi:hypothetical protein
MKDKVKDKVEREIENFILYYTSDWKEREKILKALPGFMEEVYEDENGR